MLVAFPIHFILFVNGGFGLELNQGVGQPLQTVGTLVWQMRGVIVWGEQGVKTELRCSVDLRGYTDIHCQVYQNFQLAFPLLCPGSAEHSSSALFWFCNICIHLALDIFSLCFLVFSSVRTKGLYSTSWSLVHCWYVLLYIASCFQSIVIVDWWWLSYVFQAMQSKRWFILYIIHFHCSWIISS